MLQQDSLQTVSVPLAPNSLQLEHELYLEHFLNSHPLSAVFGTFSDKVAVGVNPVATIAAVNPRWSGTDFGIFRVPTLDAFRNKSLCAELDPARASWSLTTHHTLDARDAFVPPETGRAILLPPSAHPIYRDLLLKGTGLVSRFTQGNKLRYASRGFNGFLEISEAERDLVNTEILERAGVLVAAGVGVVDHHHVVNHEGFTEWSANYLRAFRVQTRISNLFELDTPTMKLAIDDALHRMIQMGWLQKGADYVHYFQKILEICARNVAILQAIGFTQDSFHYGQVTLCGELVDLGIGSFDKPQTRGVINTLHPWFRYERQPILMLNMLYKTHAVKTEPHPVRLPLDSRAVNEQQTLFGAIQRFAPLAAAQIHALNPERLFWNLYHETYRAFDTARFRRDVLSQIEQYYSWSPEGMLEKLPEAERAYVALAYRELLAEFCKHYEKQAGPWYRRGPTSIHKQVIFSNAARLIHTDPQLDFSGEVIGFDGNAPVGGYLNESGECVNTEEDLSWKPDFEIS